MKFVAWLLALIQFAFFLLATYKLHRDALDIQAMLKAGTDSITCPAGGGK